MRRLWWILFYKYLYQPETKAQIVLKWERLNYFDFKELKGISK